MRPNPTRWPPFRICTHPIQLLMSQARSTDRSTITQPGSDVTVHRCDGCGKRYPERYGYNRSVCRHYCKYLSIADSLLNDITHDHRHCASCFRKLKEVESPTLTKKSAELGKSPPDCATGRQIYYDYTKQDLRNTNTGTPSDREYASPTLSERMTCECPANHHMTVRDWPSGSEWTRREALQHTRRMLDALDDLDSRGDHSTDIDGRAVTGFIRKAKTRNSQAERDDRDLLRHALAFGVREAT